MEVLKIFSLILVGQLLPQFRVKSWGKGYFFALFPFEKSAEVPGQVGARVHAHSSSSELTAHQMARPAVQRPSTEEGVAYDVEEYVDYQAMVGVPVGPDSTAVLLVAGRGGRVPGGQGLMAAPVGGRSGGLL